MVTPKICKISRDGEPKFKKRRPGRTSIWKPFFDSMDNYDYFEIEPGLPLARVASAAAKYLKGRYKLRRKENSTLYIFQKLP